MSGRLSEPHEQNEPRPSADIELYDRATSQTANDDILGETNLGLGNYDADWLWMQVESYRKWVYADAAVAGPLNRRVIDYALTQKAKDEWRNSSEDERADEWQDIKEYWEPSWGRLDDRENIAYDRRRWIQAKKREIWDVEPDEDATVGESEDREELRREKRLEIVNNHGRGDLEWTPPFGRLMKTRHEASRSLGSRLLDNLFERVKKQTKVLSESDSDSGGLRERL